MVKNSLNIDFGTVLGSIWEGLGRPWASCGRSWGLFGRSWGALGPLLGVLGVRMSSKTPLGWILGRFGLVLGWFWASLGGNLKGFGAECWEQLGRARKNRGQLEKFRKRDSCAFRSPARSGLNGSAMPPTPIRRFVRSSLVRSFVRSFVRTYVCTLQSQRTCREFVCLVASTSFCCSIRVGLLVFW